MTISETQLGRIDVMKPWLGEAEAQALAEVVASGWVAQGPKVREFEDAFAAGQHAGFAIATSSCTSALHLALVVAGVGAGDDVVVPSFSFIATANAAAYVGARPVFADVDLHTGCVTAATIKAALTPATKAVIAVDQGGVPVDLEPIRALCDPLGIIVVEDAACAIGSLYRGQPVGSTAELSAWSFHPRKILTTGEGGMLTTARQDFGDRARRLREHAMSVSAADRHASLLAAPEEYLEIGFNYRMTDLQAAVGIVQLSRLEAVVRRRRELAATYAQAFAGVEGLRLVSDPEYGMSNFQSCWLEVGPAFPVGREVLMAHLASDGISARRGIMAAHRQPAYAGADTGAAELGVTEWLSDHTLILPLYHELALHDQVRVIDSVLRAAGQP
ncbi:DegT/DnrJ/EryC1/StrS aminotransferase family protein [Paenarthrobacter sp. MSM-2-10-13]|uniref:DegT/DnrJ/EryC1/StrS family aminotransferase n=1 Tax=Micrococcaceae TaxID=1268 RepID=UPI00115CAE26|nr:MULTISPECIES: DegT/DnrJ/EryC1/StrS aminotransferase family protein [Micrococcaceae]MCM0615841.1 DegT/DnrJ/EryC1/StrS aminotransferase family protein [Paenarthrobacter sp. TYUT067]NHW46268.1 DegT/DnrJ/EryC1/StrS aminotransferase family protein [Paenarthrobacter sp. MSM-2-10-13]TQS91537.1 DegT/DnrJ/EryC1/StrS aminotransferase family protein [Arthrobacter sp. TS-15]